VKYLSQKSIFISIITVAILASWTFFVVPTSFAFTQATDYKGDEFVAIPNIDIIQLQPQNPKISLLLSPDTSLPLQLTIKNNTARTYNNLFIKKQLTYTLESNPDEILTLDIQIDKDPIVIRNQDALTYKTTYTAPSNLPKAEYTLIVSLIHPKLGSISHQYLKLATYNDLDTPDFLHLTDTSLSYQDQNYSTQFGISIPKDQTPPSLTITPYITNAVQDNIEAKYTWQVFKRITGGQQVLDETSIGKTKINTQNPTLPFITLPVLFEPGTYEGVLFFTDKENPNKQISNILEIKWIVIGDSAYILDSFMSRGSFNSNDTVNISTLIGVNPPPNTILNHKVTCDQGLAWSQDTALTDNTSRIFDYTFVPIQRFSNCALNISLTAGTKTLDQFSATPESVTPNLLDFNQKIFYILAFVILGLVMTFVLQTYSLYTKKSHLGIWVGLVMLVGICSISFAISSAIFTQAQNITPVSPCLGPAIDIDNPSQNFIYPKGAPLLISGKIFIPETLATATDTKVSFWIDEDIQNSQHLTFDSASNSDFKIFHNIPLNSATHTLNLKWRRDCGNKTSSGIWSLPFQVLR
jgi:hypothetical protein